MVVVCCSVLQCVAVCCSVLQYDAVCCSVLQCVAVCCSVLQRVAVCWKTVCCSVLQYVASMLHCVAFPYIYSWCTSWFHVLKVWVCSSNLNALTMHVQIFICVYVHSHPHIETRRISNFQFECTHYICWHTFVRVFECMQYICWYIYKFEYIHSHLLIGTRCNS